MNRKINNHFVFLWVVVACLSPFSTASVAENSASLTLTSNSIVFDKNSRSAVLHMVNRGDRTGVFAVRWIDHTMTEAGGMHTWKSPARSPWSIQPYARFTPRRVTLKPGESQVIRIALKTKAASAAVGEYFSHINVITINDNLEKELQRKKGTSLNLVSSSVNTSTISIKSRLGISVPVIWRNSDNQQKATIEIQSATGILSVAGEDASGNNDENATEPESSEILLTITRQGEISTRGYMHVFLRQDQAPERIMEPLPFIIYPNLESRELRIELPRRYPKNSHFFVYYSISRDSINDVIGSANAIL